MRRRRPGDPRRFLSHSRHQRPDARRRGRRPRTEVRPHERQPPLCRGGAGGRIARHRQRHPAQRSLLGAARSRWRQLRRRDGTDLRRAPHLRPWAVHSRVRLGGRGGRRRRLARIRPRGAAGAVVELPSDSESTHAERDRPRRPRHRGVRGERRARWRRPCNRSSTLPEVRPSTSSSAAPPTCRR